MRLLVLCPHFAPDPAPTGTVITRIVEELAGLGHEIDVVTSLPWYTHHRVEDGYRGRPVRVERTAWGRVVRVHPFPTDRSSIPARAVGFLGFSALSGAVGVADGVLTRPDVVLAMSPPLTLGLTGRAIATAARAPLVFNVQDVFPDVAVEVGAITDKRVIAAARAAERATYRASAAVTVLSEDLRDNLVAKVGPARAGTIRVIPNFVDTQAITPGPRDNEVRAELGLGPDDRVLMYAGNMGFSQPLELLVEVGRRRPDIHVVLVGGGSAREALEREAAGVANVHLLPFQSFERLPKVLAAADAHAVVLRRGLAKASVPSKMYSILAAGRPLLASVDEGTEVARVAEEHGCGLAVPPEDAGALAEAAWRLLRDPTAAEEMGRRGRAFVEGWASPRAVAVAYQDLFEELLLTRAARRGRRAERRGRGK